MKKTVILLVALCGLFSVNSITAQNNKLTYSSSESRDFEPRQGVIVTPLLADIKVITQTSVCDSVIFPIIVASIAPNQMMTWVMEYKKQAMSMMLKKYKADAMIAPLTDVSTTPDGKMKIIVTGYPARYTNFRNATSTDVWLVSLYGIIDKNATGTLNPQETKTVLLK